MPFDELLRGHQLPDPEARKAEDIKRSDKKVKNKKVRRSSVTLGTIKGTILVLTVIFGIAVATGIGYLIYLGFQAYING